MKRHTIVNGPLVLNGQGYDYVRVEELTTEPSLKTRKVRLTVHIDTSYAFQSHAKSEVWDGDKWNEVLSYRGANELLKLPYANANTAGSVAKAETAMSALTDTMVKEARSIVF